MKIKTPLLCLFLLSTNFLFAQQEPEPAHHLVSVRDQYFIIGFSSQGFPNGSLPEFKLMTPNSTFLHRDLSHFEENNGYDVSAGVLYSVTAGLNFRNKRKNYYMPSPQVRMGFSYYSGADIANSLSYTRIVRYDTVLSTTSPPVYLDSVFSSRYQMEHRTKQLRLDISAIFRTSRMNRWSFYGGVGFTLGAAVHSYTNIDFNYGVYIDSVNVSGHSIIEKPKNNLVLDSTDHESFSVKNGICYSLYFPFGMDLRVGKRIEFLRHVHLFYEMRPGFYYISIPELRHFRSPGMNIGFGLRIAID